MITKPLLITIGVLTVSLGLASFGLYKQIQANGALAVEIEAKEAQIKAGADLLTKERMEAQADALRAQQYFEKRVKDDEELENLRRCRADKSCWPRVRVKSACPVSDSATNAGASEEVAAELGENAERSLQRLEGEIKEITSAYLSLQAEVAARSHPDFCQPK
jgi:hypothetical protein